MAYIKVVPIKVTVKKALKYAMNDEKVKVEKEKKDQEKDKDITNELNYIMNENKTTYKDELEEDIKTTIDYDSKENMGEVVLSSGINCVADPELAYMQFNLIYQKYPEKLKVGGEQKKAIKAHHFIQSFKPGEVDPIKAHEIGKQLCEKAFQNKHQIIISTHVDKGHIHNHIILNAVGLDGKKYYSNKGSLIAVRSINDELSKENNLSIIDTEANKSKPKNNFHYKEWQARKEGTSWKQKIQLDIDKLVIKVSSLEELLTELKKQGYEFKENRKYITLKPPGKDRFVRTKTLGEEYTEESLIKRINEKDKEKPIIEKFKDRKTSYKGIQQEYNSTLSQLGIMIIRGEKKDYRRYDPKQPYSIKNDLHVNILANQLSYLTKENIQNELDLKERYNAVEKQYLNIRKQVQDLNKVIRSLKAIQEEIERYRELKAKESLTEADKIMLESCNRTFTKYNIKSELDMKKYEAAYLKANKDIEKLNEQMKQAKELNNSIKEIVNTYEKIQKNTYIEQLKQQEQERNREKER